MSGDKIVRCAIYPGIGIARVGNSTTDYFVGPEALGLIPSPGASSYKDAQGRIKRQAARFRLYGLNAAGAVVKELTSADGDITWTVHLANKKAAWYQFKMALDIPEAASPTLPTNMRARRRNAARQGVDRARLVIDPGPRSIHGANAQGPTYRFDSGTFLGAPVPLGELRTDAQGHLLVFGGLGTSGTPLPNNPATTFANNDGWHDDISDGPVGASVKIGGKALPVTPAWVIVGPPNYAPEIRAIVTLYDIAYQAYLDAHAHQAPPSVSFTAHIYPILERFDRLQWVNEGFYRGYGWKGQVPLLDPTRLAQLANPAASAAAARQTIFARFRDPAYHTLQEDAWPRIYGDSFDQPPRYPQQYLAVTREQYRRLEAWARGHFAGDWHGVPPTPPARVEDLPVAARPGALDEAALAACSGGPFHVGVEATWPLRHPTMYADLCRLNVHPDAQRELDYGDVLTPTCALGPDGPLHASGPGDITRWMAVPWQTDAASTGSAYPNSTVQPPPFPDLPTFSPEAFPNRVLTRQAYRRVMNGDLTPAQRHAAFDVRVPWTRHLAPDYQARINQFVTDWYRLAMIARQPSPTDDPSFPSEIQVELGSGYHDISFAMPAVVASTDGGASLVEDVGRGGMLAHPPRKVRVFLCHSSSDKAPVRALYRQLQQEGDIEPWLNEENLLPGQNWDYEIRKAVRESNVVLACLSSASVTRRGYVQTEIKLALDVADEQPEGTIYLIPTRLEPCNVPERLKRWQWVDLFEERGYEQLLRALRLGLQYYSPQDNSRDGVS